MMLVCLFLNYFIEFLFYYVNSIIWAGYCGVVKFVNANKIAPLSKVSIKSLIT
jgi:hypothetical protein